MIVIGIVHNENAIFKNTFNSQDNVVPSKQVHKDRCIAQYVMEVLRTGWSQVRRGLRTTSVLRGQRVAWCAKHLCL